MEGESIFPEIYFKHSEIFLYYFKIIVLRNYLKFKFLTIVKNESKKASSLYFYFFFKFQTYIKIYKLTTLKIFTIIHLLILN